MGNFTEDDIRRTGLPQDVMGLIHDLCYHVNNNLRGTLDDKAVKNYVVRAQEILKKENTAILPAPDSSNYVNEIMELNSDLAALLMSIEDMKRYIHNSNHIPWNNVLHFADKIKSYSRLELTKQSSYHLEASKY